MGIGKAIIHSDIAGTVELVLKDSEFSSPKKDSYCRVEFVAGKASKLSVELQKTGMCGEEIKGVCRAVDHLGNRDSSFNQTVLLLSF